MFNVGRLYYFQLITYVCHYKLIWMEIQAITNRSFRLLMRRNVSFSRNRTRIERLLDWKEFTSRTVGSFFFPVSDYLMHLGLMLNL